MPPEDDFEFTPARVHEGVIYGWRAWQINRGVLCSITSGTRWPSYSRLEAVHDPQKDHAETDVPCRDNLHCGIYAYSDAALLARNVGGDLAWGEVKLWGKIVVHGDGTAYRAQYAYPSLVVCPDDVTAQLVRRNYGCEVMVAEQPATVPIIPAHPAQGAAPNTIAPVGPPLGPSVPGQTIMCNLQVRGYTGMCWSYSGRYDAHAIARWIEGLLDSIVLNNGMSPGMAVQVMWSMQTYFA